MLTSPLLAFVASVVVAALVGVWPVVWIRQRARDAENVAKIRTAEAESLRNQLDTAETRGGSKTHDNGEVSPQSPSTEDRLAEASERFRSLLDSLPFPVWVRDATLDVAFANRAAEQTQPFEDSELARSAVAGNTAVSDRRPSGANSHDCLLEVVETPVDGWPGTVGFAVETKPVTNGADREILAGLATAIAVYDANAHLTFFNNAYARLFRLDADWLTTGPRLGDVLDRMRAAQRLPEVPDYRAFRAEHLDLIGSIKEAREDVAHLPDGSSIRTVVSPHPADGVVFAYDDLTDRLTLERSVAEADAVARETVDNLHEGVAVFGSDGRLRLGNPAFVRLWGFVDDVAGLHLADFINRIDERLPPVDNGSERKRRTLAAVLRRRRDRGRIVLADGTVVDYANVPLPDGSVLLSYLDVSDSVRVEQALCERAEALREADRLKSAFIADVSYEVRTPLTALQGFAQMLADGYFGTLNARQTEYVQCIVDAGNDLASVIDGILDLATIEAGMMTLELDTVDVHGLLAAVMSLVRERARHKSLRLEFDCPTDIGWIVCDERRIKQVVLNLLGNAVRFTPTRGRVQLAAGREDDTIMFAVSDTGPGIPESDQMRVFEVFERGTGSSSSASGPGLRLALVRRFVELHGGTVAMESKPGKGTTVTCRLPAKTKFD